MKNIKRTLVALMILVLTMILSGCASATIQLKINSDGSSDLNYKIGVEETTLGMMAGTGQDPFAQITENAKAKGFTTETYKEAGYAGVIAKKHLANVDELASLNLLGNEEGLPGLKIEKGFFETKYVIDGDFDLSSMKANTGSESDAMSNSIIQQFDVKYVLSMPEAIGKNNATSVSADKKTLTWQLKPGENNKIQMEAAVKNTANIAIVVGIIVVVLIGGVLIGMKKKKPLNTTLMTETVTVETDATVAGVADVANVPEQVKAEKLESEPNQENKENQENQENQGYKEN